MSDESNVCGHLKKFHRWKSRAPRETRVLADLVENIIIPKVVARSYEIKDFYFNDPEDRAIANEIHLERYVGDIALSITFSFAKYSRPKFQVHMMKRRVVKPFEYLLRGSLVCQPTQYYKWWGKPWWMPYVMWSDKRAESVVKVVGEKLNCAFLFL